MCQSKGAMKFGVFLFWGCVGDVEFSKGNLFRVAWFF